MIKEYITLKLLAEIDPAIDGEINVPRGEISNVSFGSILEIAFATLGSIAFIIIVFSGMKFVLSRGNPDAVVKARNTIVYAAIGLVISVLSFSIVRFVIGSVS